MEREALKPKRFDGLSRGDDGDALNFSEREQIRLVPGDQKIGFPLNSERQEFIVVRIFAFFDRGQDFNSFRVLNEKRSEVSYGFVRDFFILPNARTIEHP